MKPITFFTFLNTGGYTTAREIEDYAAQFGSSIRIDPDGTRHSGSVCNKALKHILRAPSSRALFGLQSFDYIQINLQDNYDFIATMEAVVHFDKSSAKDSRFDLYSLNAATAICCMLLQDGKFKIDVANMKSVSVPSKLHYLNKKLELKRKQVTNSLLTRAEKLPIIIGTVLSSMTEEEQAAVRKYNTIVRESREQGRPHVDRTKTSFGRGRGW